MQNTRARTSISGQGRKAQEKTQTGGKEKREREKGSKGERETLVMCQRAWEKAGRICKEKEFGKGFWLKQNMGKQRQKESTEGAEHNEMPEVK